MFAVVGIDQPIEQIIDDWDFLDEKIVKKFTTWQQVGGNIIGIRRRHITLTEIIDPKKGNFNSVSLTPDGLISKNHKALKMHITPGGVPHRVEHSFGFWHVNDMDEIYLPIPARFAWYCERCYTLMHEHYFATGKIGFSGLYHAEREAIGTYNGDAKLRRCPECGHDNPLAYCANPVKDTPEQAEARRQW